MIASQGHHQGKRGRKDSGDDENSRKKKKGNNPAGAKGYRKCERCRKQKQKCEFPEDNPDQRCVLCARNLLPCSRKTFTPARTTHWPFPVVAPDPSVDTPLHRRVSADALVLNPPPLSVSDPSLWTPHQPPLSEIAANIESQNPNASRQQVYQLVGNRLGTWVTLSQQTPQVQQHGMALPWTPSTTGLQPIHRDQTESGSYSSQPQTPNVATPPVSHPGYRPGGNPRPQLRRHSQQALFTTPGPQSIPGASSGLLSPFNSGGPFPSPRLPMAAYPSSSRLNFLDRRQSIPFLEEISQPNYPTPQAPVPSRLRSSTAEVPTGTSSLPSPRNNQTLSGPAPPPVPTPSPGEQDPELEPVNGTPLSSTSEDVTRSPSPYFAGSKVFWKEEWPGNAVVRPNQRRRIEDETPMTARVGAEDVTVTSHSGSGSEQRTGYGTQRPLDPMEEFYGIDESG